MIHVDWKRSTRLDVSRKESGGFEARTEGSEDLAESALAEQVEQQVLVVVAELRAAELRLPLVALALELADVKTLPHLQLRLRTKNRAAGGQ